MNRRDFIKLIGGTALVPGAAAGLLRQDQLVFHPNSISFTVHGLDVDGDRIIIYNDECVAWSSWANSIATFDGKEWSFKKIHHNPERG